MSQRKHLRNHKRQTGQYMTPAWLAQTIVADVPLGECPRILEPSCGDGAFLSAISDRLIKDHTMHPGYGEKAELVGIEIEPWLAEQSRALVSRKIELVGSPFHAKVHTADFFRAYMLETTSGEINLQRESFDLVIGNPPFGGTFDQSIEDRLDKTLGKRLGKKIKKETYAFFIVACVDLIKPGGHLTFLCSNTLLTISTMSGLRNFLMSNGEVIIQDVQKFSNETTQPMIVLNFKKGGNIGKVVRNDQILHKGVIESTPNTSWGITDEFANLFNGMLLGDFFVASSGMTTGKNEYFVRKYTDANIILEPYNFEFHNAPVTVEYELERARLGRLSTKRRKQLEEAESSGETERRVRILPRDKPEVVQLPDNRYCPYNTAINRLVFSHPTHYIFWEDAGDAVLTYKRTGNWYLRGVGGQPYFGKEGLTWPLVASKFVARYLPAGYILDSGAPCAFLKDGIHRDVLFFILAWLLSPLANRVLKNVINHTRNIQSKDFERMPYPWWVSVENRAIAIDSIKSMIAIACEGKIWTWNDNEIKKIGEIFEFSYPGNNGFSHVLPSDDDLEESEAQPGLPDF